MTLNGWGATAAPLFQCFWCDRTTTDAAKVRVSYPTGRLICDECREAS